jgi:N-acetylneuraminic acid mutarotase
MLVSGVLWLPVTPSPMAHAESAWHTGSDADFNATGAWFQNCELNGTGNDSRIVLKKAADWVQKNPAKPPAARSFFGMAAVDTDDKLVLFGGTDYSNWMDDTWVYDLSDNRWTDMAPPDGPKPRQDCQLATIYNDDKVVLFGGYSYDANWNLVAFNDTWVYDLSENLWSNVTPPVSPGVTASFAMASVSGTDTVVLFRGMTDAFNYEYVQETWTYDLSDNRWTLRSPSSSPAGRYGPAMAAIWGTDGLVLFGGYNESTGYLSDTWVYDLSDDRWYQKSPAVRPAGRYYAALATRESTDQALLFGGWTEDTYVYDLSDDLWTRLTPAHYPEARMGHGMATVPRTDRTVMFGGSAGGMSQETWVWDPTAYVRSGEYRSPPASTTGPAYFLALNWSAEVPALSTVKFQVRTAESEFNLTTRPFTGPDGSAASYYIESSQIWSRPGDSWIQYRANLSTGNASATPALEDVTITFDLFPQAPELLGPADGAWLNTSSPEFRWRFIDADTEAQGMYDWQLDRTEDFSPSAWRSGEVGSPDMSYTHTRPLTEGTWYWRVRTADAHGWSPYSGVRRLGVDITAPSAFTPFVDPAKWSSGPVDLIFLTDDNVSGVRNFTVFIDNKPYGEQRSPWTLPDLPDGTRNIVVRAVDEAGNWAEGRTKAFIDRTPPAGFEAEAEPANWTRTMPEITFSTKDNASGVDHYEVRIDAGQFFVRPSPFSVPELEDGEHDVTVRAVDRAGNIAESSVKVYIDRSKPDPLGVSVEPPGWTAEDQTVTFWTQDPTTEIARYEASIDGGAFAVRASPFTLSGLRDGQHTVTVRAFDLAGNFVEASARAFTDRTPPEPFNITAEPAGWAREAPVLTFTAYDNLSSELTYRASIDNGSFSKVKSPWTPSGLGDGVHLVRITATDGPGNSAEADISVFIDTSPPKKVVLSINNGSASTRRLGVRLQITAEDAGSGPGQMCFSDDGASYTQWEAFSPERDWTLPDGKGGHTVFVKVRDALGNEARPVSAVIEFAPPEKADGTLPVVIGAVAVIAIAAVGALLFLRLGKKKMAPPAAPPASRPPTQPPAGKPPAP